jgi:acetyl-CoA acetyltransferase
MQQEPERAGRVTAGNASQLSDGGAAVLVASRARAERNGWPVLARIVDHTSVAGPPKQLMAAPIPAVRKLLRRHGLEMGQLACFEHNEAFAAASCAVARALGANPTTMNSHGGAVAVGHPIGASGARCLVTTVNRLRREPEGALAVTTLCLGGGEVVAMLIAAGPDLRTASWPAS